MAVQPRILASNKPLIEARRKADHLKWRDAIWIVPAMVLGVLAGHLKHSFPFAYKIAGWGVALFFLAALVMVLNSVRRERRIWPHRFSRFGYFPFAYLTAVFVVAVIGGAIELIRHFVLR